MFQFFNAFRQITMALAAVGFFNTRIACALLGSIEQMLSMLATQLTPNLIQFSQGFQQVLAATQANIAGKIDRYRVLLVIQYMQEFKWGVHPLAGPNGIVADRNSSLGIINTSDYMCHGITLVIGRYCVQDQ
uniref:Uncharacterized protein n=1 Tax=Citrobacter freundii TaxID=546 RepID=A0A0K2S3N1_CITFR|nr:hypothetical protein [Citrobacter freundii]